MHDSTSPSKPIYIVAFTDCPSQRQSLEESLSGSCRLAFASRPEEASQLARSTPSPDLLLLTLDQNEGDGLDLLWKIRRSACELPILVSYPADKNISRAEKSLARALKAEPIKSSFLAPSTIATYLDTLNRQEAGAASHASAETAPPAEPDDTPASSPSSAATKTHHPGYESLKVLSVDDNPINQKVLKEMLAKRFGITHVVQSMNGLEGVNEASKSAFDFIFMDLMMPEMDGYEAAAAIRSASRCIINRATPILAITAYPSKEARIRCAACGISHFTAKPLKPKELLSILEIEFGHATPEVAPPPKTDEAAEAIDASVIDLATLTELFDGCLKTVESVLSLFPEDARESIKLLEEAINGTQELERIHNLCHKLKGSAAEIRALPLARIADEMETNCIRNDAKAAAALLPQIKEATLKTIRYIETMSHA